MRNQKLYVTPFFLNWEHVKFKNEKLKKEFSNNVFGNDLSISTFLEPYRRYAIQFCCSMQFQVEIRKFNFNDIVKKPLINADINNKIIVKDDYASSINYTMVLRTLFEYWKYGYKLKKWFINEYDYQNGDIFNPQRLTMYVKSK